MICYGRACNRFFNVNFLTQSSVIKHSYILNGGKYLTHTHKMIIRKSGGGGKIQVNYKEYKHPPREDHDYRNMKMGRPMSPHLEIHAPLLCAFVSILQRASGIILFCYTFTLSGSAILMPHGVDSLITIIQGLSLPKSVIFVLKTILGVPFWFHYVNGIRFCLWNLGIWGAFDKGVYKQTALGALCGSLILATLGAMYF